MDERVKTLLSLARAAVRLNDTGRTVEEWLAVLLLQEQDKVVALQMEVESLKVER